MTSKPRWSVDPIIYAWKSLHTCDPPRLLVPECGLQGRGAKKQIAHRARATMFNINPEKLDALE